MKPAPFAYAKAKSLDHAIELLARPDGEARLLAGGQSLIATLNMRLSAPKLLIDLNGIGGLAGIAVKDGEVEIGALTRHAEAERSAEIARHAPLIALAMPHIGHAAIRNRGTLGGSIAFADPAAELPACLLALGGEVDIAGPNGRRTVKADDFFKGLFETALGPGRRADRDPRSRRDRGHTRGFRRVRAPPWRLRDGRPRRLCAGRRQGTGRRAARLFRRRQCPAARQESRDRAHRGQHRRGGEGARRRSRPLRTTCRRPARRKSISPASCSGASPGSSWRRGHERAALRHHADGERRDGRRDASMRGRRWSISCATIWC